MRISATVDDLTAEQWSRLSSVLLTEYDLTSVRSRVCATFVHEGLERHVEMPLGIFSGLLISMQISAMGQAMTTFIEGVGKAAQKARERTPKPRNTDVYAEDVRDPEV